MCFGSLFKGKQNSAENFEDDVFMELKNTNEDSGNYSTSPSADKLLNEVKRYRIYLTSYIIYAAYNMIHKLSSYYIDPISYFL